jgi:hypothetical protein
MLTKIKQDMTATLALKDGPSIPEVIGHLAPSVLTTLLTPSYEVKRAVALAIARWVDSGAPLSDEIAEEIFIAGINAASKP